MSNATEIVESYLASFNETDPDTRRAMLATLYDEDSTYTDPHVDLCGPEQIDTFISGTQERFPGFRFRLAGDVDAHHEQMRFQWHAAPADEPNPLYVGFDVIATSNGKIRRVYGFMDAGPES